MATPTTVGRRRWARVVQHQGALISLVVAVAFGSARYVAFPTPENLLNVLRQNSMVGLLALGMTFVILTGGIDLSVGSLLAASGVAAAALAPHGSLAALAAAVALAAALGAANGVLVAKARMQPFVVTLATMIAVRGGVLAYTNESSLALAPDAAGLAWLGRGAVGPLPAPVLVLAAAFALGAFALRYTTFGRHVYAVGDDPEAARLLGLGTDRVIVATYALSGALAGLAGVLHAARLGAGQPVAGEGWELDAIAAVVVGGTLLTGGVGGAGLTLVGVLLLGIILNLLNLEGTFSPWWQWVIRGVFLLAVVVVQARVQRRAEAGRE
jgi:ribose transport system permease protein